MNTTIEINEEEYLKLLADKEALQNRADRLELFLFGILKQSDKLVKDLQNEDNNTSN